jgi:hypothetical protein
MIYIKAIMQPIHSVFMAEVGALALAASIIDALAYTQVNFFSDNRLLVDFLNSQDHPNMLDWRSIPYTQIYSNLALHRTTSLS